MKLIIKEEYLDVKIFDPLTKKEILARFIPEELYNFYYNKGYYLLFDKIYEKKSKVNDIPE